MAKKERKFHFMYSNNTDEQEYKVRKNFTEMFVEQLMKKGFSMHELIVGLTVILIVIAIYFLYR